MRTFRVIPRLEIKGPNLVKGVHLEGLRVLGKPEEFAYRYYQDGADELIYMDVVASLYGRNSLLDFVSRTAEKIFIPLTVGGGIRTIEDIRSVLRAGADKGRAINTAAINNPGLITEAAEVFGSQCIVISIEAKRKPDGRYEAYTDNGREKTGVDVYEWAKKAAGLGAGELLVTSIDREGTGKGFDTELIREVSTSVAVPVIACGGAGRKEHFADAVKDGRADALCASSVFHYNRLRDILEEDKFKEEGNIEYLKKFSRTKQPFEVTKHDLFNIKTLKQYLAGESIACRLWIVDYGLGNLFSVERALRYLGADCVITADAARISAAGKLILPGVGAFGDGMKGLAGRGLVEPIKDLIATGRPFMGICLGMQLLMTEGEEFGIHKGLDIIKGRTSRLDGSGGYKIPHIGWNSLIPPGGGNESAWQGTVLGKLRVNSFVYFVHSNAVVPDDASCCLASTSYGSNTFCSVVRKDNIYGCQFHPERSAETGLDIYREFLSLK